MKTGRVYRILSRIRRRKRLWWSLALLALLGCLGYIGYLFVDREFWCYLVTPLISRQRLSWRVYSSLTLFGLLLIARWMFPSIDNRFVFDVLFYFVGVVTAPGFDWKFNIPYGSFVKSGIILVFLFLVAFVSIYTSFLYHPLFQMVLGAAGVFVILFVCELSANRFLQVRIPRRMVRLPVRW